MQPSSDVLINKTYKLVNCSKFVQIYETPMGLYPLVSYAQVQRIILPETADCIDSLFDSK